MMDGAPSMDRLSMSKRRGILTALLVVVGLATSVVVAQAALPKISDVTVPPVARFGVACSGCHNAAAAEPVITETRASDVASSTVKADGGNGTDDQCDNGGHETVVPARAAANERSFAGRPGKHAGEQARDGDDAGDSADRDEAKEHETVGEHAHERDHEGDRERRDGDDERSDDDSSD